MEIEKMKIARLFCRSANVYGFNKTKTGFDKHNLRLDELKPEEQNYQPELTKNNLIQKNGKAVDPTQFEELLNSVEMDQNEKMKLVKGGASPDTASELAVERKKTKYKVKQWIDKLNDSPEEQAFFERLHSKIGVEPINAAEELAELDAIPGKTKRFNDKKRAIKTLEKTNKLLDMTENGSLSLKVTSSEKVFKIPDKHNINVKPEHWLNIANQFHKKFYSNFDQYYSVVHMDENPENPHVHHRFSGFNNETKKFDLPDHELNMIRRLAKKPDLFDGKKWSKLNEDEIKQFGEMYQTVVFKWTNNALKKYGYDVEVKKRTKQEIEKDNHTYSNKKIRDRKYNGVNKLKDEETDLISKKSELEMDIDDLDYQIENKNDKLNEIKDEITKENTKLDNVKNWLDKNLGNWFKDLIRFKKHGLEDDLNKAVDFHNEVEKVQNNDVLDELRNEINNSLNDGQKEQYENQKQSRRKKFGLF